MTQISRVMVLQATKCLHKVIQCQKQSGSDNSFEEKRGRRKKRKEKARSKVFKEDID